MRSFGIDADGFYTSMLMSGFMELLAAPRSWRLRIVDGAPQGGDEHWRKKPRLWINDAGEWEDEQDTAVALYWFRDPTSGQVSVEDCAAHMDMSVDGICAKAEDYFQQRCRILAASARRLETYSEACKALRMHKIAILSAGRAEVVEAERAAMARHAESRVSVNLRAPGEASTRQILDDRREIHHWNCGPTR